MEPEELEQELEEISKSLSQIAQEAFDLYKQGKSTVQIALETDYSVGFLYTHINPEIVSVCKRFGWKVSSVKDVKKEFEAKQKVARRRRLNQDKPVTRPEQGSRTSEQDKPVTQPEPVRIKLPWKWLLGILIIGVILFVGWVIGSIFPWSVVQIPAPTSTSTVTSIISAIVPVTETPTINITATFTQFPAVSPTLTPTTPPTNTPIDTPTPTPVILFFDDFSGDLSKWTQLGFPPFYPNNRVVIANEAITTSDVHGAWVVANIPAETNYQIIINFESKGCGGSGNYFSTAFDDTYNMISLNADACQFHWGYTKGSHTLYKYSGTRGLAGSGKQRLVITVRGNKISAELNRTEAFSVFNEKHAQGKIAIYIKTNDIIDDVTVIALQE